MFLRLFLAQMLPKFYFYNYERIFSLRDLKFGGSVYIHMRNKKGKVDRWWEMAFDPLKRHFSILGFLRLIEKKT